MTTPPPRPGAVASRSTRPLRLALFAVIVAVAAGALAPACSSQPNFTIPVCESLHTHCACQITDWIICDRVCVDPLNDRDNCGGCGVHCDGVCLEGRCASDCGGRERCGDRCRSDVDPYNCGACGTVCQGGCSAGRCGSTAAECTRIGKTACNGVCVVLAYDPDNCGGCGIRCGTGLCGFMRCCLPGEVLCNGLCANLQTSPANCGRCGHPCEICVDGVCQ